MQLASPSLKTRLKNVGASLKSLISPSVMSMPLPYTQGGTSGLSSFWFFGANGTEQHFTYSGLTSCVTAYTKCAPFAAVINRKTAAHLNGKTWVLDKGGKKDGKESERKEAKKLRALLNQPNPLQSWSQFEAQAYLYKQVFGFCPVLAIKPVGFENYEAKALYNLPPWCCDIQEEEGPYAQSSTTKAIRAIVFTYGRQRTTITDNFFVLQDFTPSMQTLALPGSRVAALADPISNAIGAMESRRVLINNRGAQGILSSNQSDDSGAVALSPTEKAAVQNDLKQYGLRSDQTQIIITSANVKWQSMAQPAKDLMLIEEIKDSTQQICDQYGYPYRLMSANDVNSLGGSDLKEYKKAFYQDTVIPEAADFYEQLGRFFKLDKYELRFDKDYSHLPILQEDATQQATARKTLNEALELEWKNGLITKNQWLKKLGEDPVEGGDIRISDVQYGGVPLASLLGEHGVSGMLEVLTASGMSAEARRNTLEIVFGLNPADALRMAPDSPTNDSTNATTTATETTAAGA